MLDIFSKNLEAFLAEMPLSANLFQLGSTIQKHAGSRGVAPVGGEGGEAPRKKKILPSALFEGGGNLQIVN